MKADKNLGQHFLVNQGVIERIVNNVSFFVKDMDKEWVVEIGPGKGALTDPLLKKGYKVAAFDLDTRMIELLKKKHADLIKQGRFKIFHCDATSEQFSEEIAQIPCSTIFGNLPYNVGTEIVIRLYEEQLQVKNFCFMLQKEVVDRFLASHNSKAYSPISIRWHWGTRLLERFHVNASSFSPPPEVESAVFSYSRKEAPAELSPHQNLQKYLSYVKVLKRAFLQRRKMLRKNIPELKETQWGALRAEQIDPEEFINLCSQLV